MDVLFYSMRVLLINIIGFEGTVKDLHQHTSDLFESSSVFYRVNTHFSNQKYYWDETTTALLFLNLKIHNENYRLLKFDNPFEVN